MTPEAMEALQHHNWKGNIRELENCIERAMILAERDEIEPRHLLIGASLNSGNSYMPNAAVSNALPTIAELVNKALERSGGDEKAAANLIGCDVKTLRAWKD